MGDFALLGGSLERGAFKRRLYMLCRQRGKVTLLFFSPSLSCGGHVEHLTAYAGWCSAHPQRSAWTLWAISPESLPLHEATARVHGLTAPLLTDADCAAAKLFGLADEGGYTPAVFLIGPDRTLLWKSLSPGREPPVALGPLV
ncbi:MULTISPECIES: redoxin domain-containing protein [unclassified Streptomyces]|uniref:redoxin domain-containing protein n=1 Tax=unclassified Streptomyces TaxID=2593676 RepID=UPI0035DC265A